jgi:hypothetical protein
MPEQTQPRHDLTTYPVQDDVWVEVYWRDDSAGRGPCASLYAHTTELLRFDCFDGDQGHCHVNFWQNRGERWYYRPGTVRQHIDQSAYDLAKNFRFALRSSDNPTIQGLKLDPAKLQEVAQQMRERLLELAGKLGM